MQFLVINQILFREKPIKRTHRKVIILSKVCFQLIFKILKRVKSMSSILTSSTIQTINYLNIYLNPLTWIVHLFVRFGNILWIWHFISLHDLSHYYGFSYSISVGISYYCLTKHIFLCYTIHSELSPFYIKFLSSLLFYHFSWLVKLCFTSS